MKPRLFVLGLAAGLFGCAGAPSDAELRGANYGQPIGQADAERLAAAYLGRRLKDPASASYEWQPVAPGWVRDPVITGGALHFGYRLVGQVNAKNSFGGYTGPRRYEFILRDGTVRGAWAEEVGSYGSVMAPLY